MFSPAIHRWLDWWWGGSYKNWPQNFPSLHIPSPTFAMWVLQHLLSYAELTSFFLLLWVLPMREQKTGPKQRLGKCLCTGVLSHCFLLESLQVLCMKKPSIACWDARAIGVKLKNPRSFPGPVCPLIAVHVAEPILDLVTSWHSSCLKRFRVIHQRSGWAARPDKNTMVSQIHGSVLFKPIKFEAICSSVLDYWHGLTSCVCICQLIFSC